MTIEEMKARKRELGYSYQQIAELSDLPVGTVQKVLGGITKSPRFDTLQALERVLSEKDQFPSGNIQYDAKNEEDNGMNIAEPQYSYAVKETSEEILKEKKQGEYTLEDYYQLPDERRVELIDGVFYDMASPTSIHQIMSGEIFNYLKAHINKNKGKCIPAYAPLDVQLDCDDKTMVQPDVLIVCDRSKFKGGVVYGAPDLVVEILSPSTWKKDMYLKLSKYTNAGVREYWLVDPIRKKVLVYELEKEEWPAIYGFENEVPVGIFEGKCKVPFAEIYEYLKFLYEQEEENG